MHFREVSWDGRSFAHPSLAHRLAMIAFSRLLDQDEILVAINLSSEERRIWVGVEEGLYPSGGEMVSLMRGVPRVPVRKKWGRSYVVLSIHPYQLLILKNKF